MSSGLASFHSILKDETRRRIVVQLSQKGSLSHSELMENLGFLTTGLLDYHFTQLDGLLTKDEAGRYALSEKGKVAARLLTEFPDQNSSRNTQVLITKIFYAATGVFLGVCVSFFGIVLLSLVSLHFGGPSIAEQINNTFEVVAVLAFPAVVGGIVMYWFGKKRGFKRPEPKYPV